MVGVDAGASKAAFPRLSVGTISQESVEVIISELQPFINRLQQDGFNIGVDSYCRVHNLLLALAAQGKLPADFSQLRTLIAPVLCCSEKEQESFNRYFDDWLQVLQPQSPTVAPIVEELAKVEQEQKKTKQSFGVLALLVSLLLGLVVTPYGNYLGELISWSVFEKLNPAIPADIFNAPKLKTDIPKAVELPQEQINPHPKIPQLKFSNLDNAEFALWATLAVLALTLLWYLIRYLQLQRFLKRHSALQPPDMAEFFLKNQQQALYSSVAFARTAQQLHKHRDLDAHLLDVEATVKRTIAECGFYTPVYKAIKALPEYLVLIDRASFNDQLSHFVDALLQELDDFGLFIERYYFDGDPRRCYAAKHPTKPCTLDSLQSLYANHRLIIFADSSHFLNPVSGKLYGWLGKFHEWQQPFLFTLESPQHWNYDKQQLHEAGFVVLATGQKGLEELVSYISADLEAISKERGNEADKYPVLLQQRPRRFLERHAPAPEIEAELLTQLEDYLGQAGFNWLAACAVYPELHWQLTLYLGKNLSFPRSGVGTHPASLQRRGTQSVQGGIPTPERGNDEKLERGNDERLERENDEGLDEALLLRLARLPWLRYSYMPDWLREALLFKLNKQAERAIRNRLQSLLLTITTQGSADAFNLTIAQKSPLLSMMREVLLVWKNNTDDDNPVQDYVFQSLMAGRLAVKLPKVINKHLVRFGLLAKIRLLLVLTAIMGAGLGIVSQKCWFNDCQPPKRLPVIAPQPEQKTITTLAPAMVAIKGGCFLMGSPETEPERYKDEKQHQVCVKDFVIGKYEVTQAQWQAVMGNNPSYFKGENLPVETVSWDDVQIFIKKLNVLTGKTYRLPTEAEWEYAARAGTTTPFYTGNCISTNQANYNGNYNYNNCGAKTGVYKQKTVAVGSYSANGYGLHDMAGNVWEWTCSGYDEKYEGEEMKCISNNDAKTLRAVRGGSWGDAPDWLRSADRFHYTPGARYDNLGLRLSRM